MKATLRYLRIAPRKTRLVANLVRGKSVAEALSILQFTKRSASEPVRKLIASAWPTPRPRTQTWTALVVKRSTWTRGLRSVASCRALMGRATRINKKTSHVTCVLAERS
jgi:large subunit ribosomal protein L22